MPSTALILALIYLILPATSGVLASPKTPKIQRASKFVLLTMPSKVFIFLFGTLPKKLFNYRNILRPKYLFSQTITLYNHLKKSDALELTSLLFIVLVGFIYVLTALTQAGVSISRPVRLFFIAITTIIPVILFLLKLKVIPVIKKHYTLTKWSIGIITLAATYVLGIVSDASIVTYTNSRAENFPLAQKAITFIFTLTGWWIVAVMIGTAAYLLQTLNLIRLMFRDHPAVSNISYRLSFILDPDHELTPYPKKKKKVVMKHEMTLFIGLGFFATLSLAIWEGYLRSESIDSDLQDIIVMTSFHADGRACGFPDNKDLFISVLPMGKMIAATRISGGKYLFEPGLCTPTLYKPRPKVDLSIFNASLN
jgi:hypothetical protein